MATTSQNGFQAPEPDSNIVEFHVTAEDLVEGTFRVTRDQAEQLMDALVDASCPDRGVVALRHDSRYTFS